MTPLSQVVIPGRFLDRMLGGNTTYARALAARLPGHGVGVGRVRAGRTAPSTLCLEQSAVLARWPEGTVLHWVGDTGPLARPRAASVVTVHGVASRWVATARNPSQEAIWRARVRAAIAASDLVITVSESSAEDVGAVFGVERSRTRVIPHGIDHDRYRPGPPDARLPGRLGIPAGPYLLYLGNIEPRKNLLELVAAVEAAPDLPRLVVAGRPAWNAGPSMAAIARASRTTHVGFVPSHAKVALMRGCAALVFPSLYEGFGFPVLEALACGAPVVCTSAGALAEFAGPSWRLAGPGRDEIRVGLRSALADAEWLRRCETEGPAWTARFDWGRSVLDHLDAYAQALAVHESKTTRRVMSGGTE